MHASIMLFVFKNYGPSMYDTRKLRNIASFIVICYTFTRKLPQKNIKIIILNYYLKIKKIKIVIINKLKEIYFHVFPVLKALEFTSIPKINLSYFFFIFISYKINSTQLKLMTVYI